MVTNDAEWLTCTTPRRMIECLRGKASDRKGRLFVCACCRRIWQILSGELRGAVAIGERYADGEASVTEREKLYMQFVVLLGLGKPEAELAVRAAMRTLAPKIDTLAWEEMVVDGAYSAAEAAVELGTAPDKIRQQAIEDRWQCSMIRCIFGNPFRPVTVDPAWSAWNDGTAVKIARSIYDERRFEDLPILADALEDAGCTVADILGHCREPGVHARGCWVVDMLLDRQI